jgi:hypothetical protein
MFKVQNPRRLLLQYQAWTLKPRLLCSPSPVSVSCFCCGGELPLSKLGSVIREYDTIAMWTMNLMVACISLSTWAHEGGGIRLSTDEGPSSTSFVVDDEDEEGAEELDERSLSARTMRPLEHPPAPNPWALEEDHHPS